MPLENHDLRTTQSPAEVPPPGAIETALAGIQALPETITPPCVSYSHCKIL